ncbi:MAG: hypothetical protein HC878_00115 [Leptolyngbyaceae cyanobacterium SL_5_14]|nr:hypothetical protein [Leptolyngbyaceae cyanobacterium SL_5_14]
MTSGLQTLLIIGTIVGVALSTVLIIARSPIVAEFVGLNAGQPGIAAICDRPSSP